MFIAQPLHWGDRDGVLNAPFAHRFHALTSWLRRGDRAFDGEIGERHILCNRRTPVIFLFYLWIT